MNKIKLLTGFAAIATMGTSTGVLASCSHSNPTVELSTEVKDKGIKVTSFSITKNKDSTITFELPTDKVIKAINLTVGGKEVSSSNVVIDTPNVTIKAEAMTDIKVTVTGVTLAEKEHIEYKGETTFDITFQSIVPLKIDLDREYTDKEIKTVDVIASETGIVTSKFIIDGKNIYVFIIKNQEANITADKETTLEIKVTSTTWTQSITGLKLNWNVEDVSKCRLVAFADTKVDITLGENSHDETNKLEVSTNGKEFEAVTADKTIEVTKGQSLYFRGTNPNGVGGKGYSYQGGMHLWITANDGTDAPSCYLLGSIMSLIDNGANTSTAAPANGFNYLFYNSKKGQGSTGIECVSKNFLPATKVGGGAYMRLFNNATNLLFCPELPATELEKNAYEHMFSGCSSILVTPELKMAIIPDYGYQSMFNECSSIIIVGKIHAKELGEFSCDNMFCDNKALKIKETSDPTDPNLFFTCPAGTEKLQVNQMFGGCGATPIATPEAGKSYAWYR